MNVMNTRKLLVYSQFFCCSYNLRKILWRLSTFGVIADETFSDPIDQLPCLLLVAIETTGHRSTFFPQWFNACILPLVTSLILHILYIFMFDGIHIYNTFKGPLWYVWYIVLWKGIIEWKGISRQIRLQNQCSRKRGTVSFHFYKYNIYDIIYAKFQSNSFQNIRLIYFRVIMQVKSKQ
jgi:hypothetical protein